MCFETVGEIDGDKESAKQIVIGRCEQNEVDNFGVDGSCQLVDNGVQLTFPV